MSYRGRIHINKIPDFMEYLLKEGWTLKPLTNIYEKIRASKDGRTIIYYQRDNGTKHSDHLSSSQNLEQDVAERFLRKSREPS